MDRITKIIIILLILSILLMIILLLKNNNINENKIVDDFVYIEEISDEVK